MASFLVKFSYTFSFYLTVAYLNMLLDSKVTSKSAHLIFILFEIA